MPSAICLIVKNERDDISEWIAHHVGIGTDRLIIYDDQSNDGTAEHLETLSQHFPIDVIHWRTSEVSRQNAAYKDCLTRYASTYEWIGFLDADEFLIPPKGASLPQLLERHQNHDAFAINWLIFGTSGIADTNGRFVMESFIHRANTQFNDNRHVKAFVRPNQVESVLNAHYFVGPTYWADVMGDAMKWGKPLGVVEEGGVILGDWRVHHYLLRSDNHWQRRLARGRANTIENRSQEFYIHNDRNEVRDLTALEYAALARLALTSRGLLNEPSPPEAIRRKVPTLVAASPQVQPVARNIRLHIDKVDARSVEGWAQDDEDRDHTSPLKLQFLVDQESVAQISCDGERDDVEKAGFRRQSGFRFELSRTYFDGIDHTLTVQTVGRQNIVIHQADGASLQCHFKDTWTPEVISNVDGFHGNTIRGWALSKDERGSWVGSQNLAIICDNAVIGYARADGNRPDVARYHSADATCGFEYVIPHAYRSTEEQEFAIKVVPHETELYGSPLKHTFPDHEKAATHIEDGYDGWARHYLDALRVRVETERDQSFPLLPAPNRPPSVSIICPVYRPKLGNFEKAVRSVQEQTFADWELILVDDGSAIPELKQLIESFAEQDHRIRAVFSDSNEGIAMASNKAIALAEGSYVAFFDHDDVLVNVALEVMMQQAKSSGALLLYSDEDKIDHNDQYTDPALKPEWNYRMMLSANYICHFVMVDRGALDRVGPLSSTYNGAQDHDLLLRLSEIIPADQIKHVPEILYHWRICEGSTACNPDGKPYALEAGQRAIEDHLKRKGLETSVTNCADRTWYQVNWSFTDEPKVCIIIPFKDQIEMTRECFERVTKLTQYKNYEIILVDNGSVTQEALTFAAYAAQNSNVRILHDDGPFNFSRLNNRAAAETNADYLVLMNNDLHIRTIDWLRIIINEALADPTVGIVGGKFLYANDTVQHAGVVLGVGGVACHINGGIAESDPGYSGRALMAQELSAVTAACLLVDKKLYDQVGGLDEEHLAVAFNDIDLCLKVSEQGRKVIWTPAFHAYHLESISRGTDDHDQTRRERFSREAAYMQKRWSKELGADPYYSRFFTLDAHAAFRDLINPNLLPGRSVPLAPVRASQWIHG